MCIIRAQLADVARKVRSALVKHKDIADGFVARELMLVEHGQTYDDWTEVARFPLS